MIVFIHHSVNPYRTGLFNALAKTKTDFKVYFLSSPAKNRKWNISDYNLNFPHEFLKGWKFYLPGNDHWYFQISSNVWQKLEKDKPTMIVSFGWNFMAAFVAFFYSKIKRVKFVIWSGSTKYEPSLLRTLTLPIVKLLVKNTDFLITYGSRAKDYLVSLGVPSIRCFKAYNTVNTEKFIKEGKKYQKSNFIRRKYKIPDNKKIVFFVGQYIKRKGVYPLLEVANKLKDNKKIVFLFVGYGSEEEGMKRYIGEHDLKNVILSGFIKNEDLIKYYATCDLYILPSFEEVWGLVVNEAMCAGKPVLVSKYAGSSKDIVKNGFNGFVIDPSNIGEMASKILYLLDKDRSVTFGGNSLEIIRKINYQQSISQILKIYNKK